MKKLTKREMFEQLKANYPLTEMEIEFIDHELELLARKNSSEKKPTANQLQNEEIKNAVLEGMEDEKKYTISDMIKEIAECSELTNQKLSALVRQLVAEDKVERVEEKRKAYFFKK